jgi:hypothetical protein
MVWELEVVALHGLDIGSRAAGTVDKGPGEASGPVCGLLKMFGLGRVESWGRLLICHCVLLAVLPLSLSRLFYEGQSMKEEVVSASEPSPSSKREKRKTAKAHRLAPFPGGKRGSRLRNPLDLGIYFGLFSPAHWRGLELATSYVREKEELSARGGDRCQCPFNHC